MLYPEMEINATNKKARLVEYPQAWPQIYFLCLVLVAQYLVQARSAGIGAGRSQHRVPGSAAAGNK